MSNPIIDPTFDKYKTILKDETIDQIKKEYVSNPNFDINQYIANKIISTNVNKSPFEDNYLLYDETTKNIYLRINIPVDFFNFPSPDWTKYNSTDLPNYLKNINAYWSLKTLNAENNFGCKIPPINNDGKKQNGWCTIIEGKSLGANYSKYNKKTDGSVCKEGYESNYCGDGGCVCFPINETKYPDYQYNNPNKVVNGQNDGYNCQFTGCNCGVKNASYSGKDYKGCDECCPITEMGNKDDLCVKPFVYDKDNNCKIPDNYELLRLNEKENIAIDFSNLDKNISDYSPTELEKLDFNNYLFEFITTTTDSTGKKIPLNQFDQTNNPIFTGTDNRQYISLYYKKFIKSVENTTITTVNNKKMNFNNISELTNLSTNNPFDFLYANNIINRNRDLTPSAENNFGCKIPPLNNNGKKQNGWCSLKKDSDLEDPIKYNNKTDGSLCAVGYKSNYCGTGGCECILLDDLISNPYKYFKFSSMNIKISSLNPKLPYSTESIYKNIFKSNVINQKNIDFINSCMLKGDNDIENPYNFTPIIQKIDIPGNSIELDFNFGNSNVRFNVVQLKLEDLNKNQYNWFPKNYILWFNSTELPVIKLDNTKGCNSSYSYTQQQGNCMGPNSSNYDKQNYVKYNNLTDGTICKKGYKSEYCGSGGCICGGLNDIKRFINKLNTNNYDSNSFIYNLDSCPKIPENFQDPKTRQTTYKNYTPPTSTEIQNWENGTTKFDPNMYQETWLTCIYKHSYAFDYFNICAIQNPADYKDNVPLCIKNNKIYSSSNWNAELNSDKYKNTSGNKYGKDFLQFLYIIQYPLVQNYKTDQIVFPDPPGGYTTDNGRYPLPSTHPLYNKLLIIGNFDINLIYAYTNEPYSINLALTKYTWKIVENKPGSGSWTSDINKGNKVWNLSSFKIQNLSSIFTNVYPGSYMKAKNSGQLTGICTRIMENVCKSTLYDDSSDKLQYKELLDPDLNKNIKLDNLCADINYDKELLKDPIFKSLILKLEKNNGDKSVLTFPELNLLEVVGYFEGDSYKRSKIGKYYDTLFNPLNLSLNQTYYKNIPETNQDINDITENYNISTAFCNVEKGIIWQSSAQKVLNFNLCKNISDSQISEQAINDYSPPLKSIDNLWLHDPMTHFKCHVLNKVNDFWTKTNLDSKELCLSLENRSYLIYKSPYNKKLKQGLYIYNYWNDHLFYKNNIKKGGYTKYFGIYTLDQDSIKDQDEINVNIEWKF